MDCELSEYAYQVLSELYDNCFNMYGTKNQSLIVSLIGKKNNDRAEALKKSAIDTNYLDSETKQLLIDNNLTYAIKNTPLIGITVQGILFVEGERNPDSLNLLCEGLQSKYFNLFAESNMTARNHITLFSMIALRCFSENCCVDLRTTVGVSSVWWDILLKSSNFLVDMGVIKEKDSLKNYTSSGIEAPASVVIRHSDRLPRITNEIFSTSKKNQYWLDVLDDDSEPNVDKLAFLIKQTLGDSIDLENVFSFINFCNDLCLEFGYSVESSMIDSHFLGCEYDSLIRKAFEKSITISIN